MSELARELLIPNWPAPAGVRACVTTRAGGVSLPPYESFNLGDHVGDAPDAVAENRRRLTAEFGIQPAWLKQVHGVVVADADPSIIAEADASWTATPGVACTVMTADCLPLLFCDRAGTRVAAAHAGWRGLANGVIEATLDRLALPPEEVLVWLGPAIGPQAFEVGLEVRDAFTTVHPETAQAFVPGASADKLMADIYMLARLRLAVRGVTAVYGGGYCTVSDQRFYSYRRTPQGGRFASLIWLAPR
ncbi:MULTISPECIES: peptidoglycan editing factor PgeF [Pseudomonas]|uniref:Purine nucleoside phosphorylase n=1 Tax=Pseudomonas auratipiscis TaxID=3115853 RepID=A0AB35WTH0_9PSED|nr:MULTISPECIES: peptidoglycan editing factor PgeF [unclassified Pseudomonas]MEE1867986.1 peptidoglycan editing factor PgeF [Pseudomonas sp. 120P]MEE1960955.1 peptidoglycan editing factor PgeF [Pseudomonas sp. 119P]